MSEQLPDFDTPTAPPVAEAPPKKRRKPMKRRAKRAAPVAPVPKKRKAMKRRGRPPGARNKPNGDAAHHGGRFNKEQYRLIGALLELPAADRASILDVVAGLAK